MTYIPVFVGGGKRYTAIQAAVFDSLCSALLKRNLQPSIYPQESWNSDDPLRGVIEHMNSCYGCLMFSVPRYYAPLQYEFPNSDLETLRLGVLVPTVWDYIEATAAYVRGMPILSIVEESLYTQAILSAKYEDYHVYTCKISANYPSLIHELHNELDDFARRVRQYYRPVQ